MEKIEALVYKNPKMEFKKFIKFFSDAYFLNNERVEGICYSQTSKWVEDEVLKEFNWDRKTLARMLAWKTGRIRHKESNKNSCETDKKIIYTKDWLNCEEQNPSLYGRIMDIGKLLDNLNSNKQEIQDCIYCDDLDGCFTLLMKNKVDGIGPVYVITLIFYISEGKYPIYDRFADNALKAIINGQIPDYREGKKAKAFNLDHYKEYMGNMKRLYIEYYEDENINYLENRELDRALWVYGHGYFMK